MGRKKNVVVLGMPRSGTSLTAGIFGRQGYFAGEEITPPNHLNPRGYWEEESVVDYNARLLQATGFAHDNTWTFDPLTPEQIHVLDTMELGEAERTFLSGFDARTPWLWKDPRLCFTLRAWWPLMDQTNTSALLIERDREAIYRSFVRAGWRDSSAADRADVFARTDAHIASAKRTFADLGIPNLCIRYEDFAQRPVEIVARINAHFGLELVTADLGYEPELNHDNVVGMIGTRLDKIVMRMPPWERKVVKAMVPGFLQRLLYPERG